MKTISPVKFTLATFAFTWLLLAIAILSGQSSKEFPAILFYIIGGCGPSLVALFFVWRNFNVEQRREFWSRVFSPRRVRPIWWIVTLVAVPAAMLLGVWVDTLVGGTLPQMDYVNLLKSQPAEIPVFIIMMLIGGPLAEELGWRGLLLDAFQKKWPVAVSSLVLVRQHVLAIRDERLPAHHPDDADSQRQQPQRIGCHPDPLFLQHDTEPAGAVLRPDLCLHDHLPGRAGDWHPGGSET